MIVRRQLVVHEEMTGCSLGDDWLFVRRQPPPSADVYYLNIVNPPCGPVVELICLPPVHEIPITK